MKNLSKILNGLILLVIAAMLLLRLPIIVNNLKAQGQLITEHKVTTIQKPINQQGISLFPPLKSSYKKSLLLFWSTNCTPCLLEMNRLKKSVESLLVDGGKVYALNPWENRRVIKRFLQKNTFPFYFIESPSLVREFKVKSTPTTVFLDGNKIISLSSGISFIGIWRAENFLRD